MFDRRHILDIERIVILLAVGDLDPFGQTGRVNEVAGQFAISVVEDALIAADSGFQADLRVVVEVFFVDEDRLLHFLLGDTAG